MRRQLTASIVALAALTAACRDAASPTEPTASAAVANESQGPQALGSIKIEFKSAPTTLVAGTKFTFQLKAIKTTLGIRTSTSVPSDVKWTAYRYENGQQVLLPNAIRSGTFTAPLGYRQPLRYGVRAASAKEGIDATAEFTVTPLSPIVLRFDQTTTSVRSGEKLTLKFGAYRDNKKIDTPSDLKVTAGYLLPDGGLEEIRGAVNSSLTTFSAPAGLRAQRTAVIKVSADSGYATTALDITVLPIAPLRLAFSTANYAVKAGATLRPELKAFRATAGVEKAITLPADIAWAAYRLDGDTRVPTTGLIDSKGAFRAPDTYATTQVFEIVATSASEEAAAVTRVTVSPLPPLVLRFSEQTISTKAGRNVTLNVTATREGKSATKPTDLVWSAERLVAGGVYEAYPSLGIVNGAFTAPTVFDGTLTLRVTVRSATYNASASVPVIVTK